MKDFSDTERALREKFPAPRYRVSRGEYPAGTLLPCAMSEGQCYVLSGACKYSNPSFELTLGPGECGMMKSGEYQFEVVGDSSVVLVHVWDLEDLMKR